VHFSFTVCFVSTWAPEGRVEGKGELCAKKPQHSPVLPNQCYSYTGVVKCAHFSYHTFLHIQLLSKAISSPLFPFSSSVLHSSHDRDCTCSGN
jgi:hypothetical protein